ncbi:uncharacterized protein [Panulirus ornatus]|uniref:uncharacterized protein isoform X4 n=1 Tax=Panulirus ornatus TaxID=150431 RepID=UPI003A8848A1
MEEEFETRAWDEAPDAEPLEEDEALSPADIQSNCLRQFSSTDFIMEPGIFSTLKRYFQAGGNPEQVIEMLSENYQAVAQMANLMAEWLILTGTCDLEEGERLVTTFDPQKAYSKVKLAWHVPKVIEPCLSASTSSSVNDKPPESSSNKEKVTPPSASSDSQTSGADDPGVGSNEKKDAEPKTKDIVPKEEVEEKWSQERMMNLSRKFNLDLAPKLLFSRGPLVELLISSNVASPLQVQLLRHVEGSLKHHKQ